MIQNEGQNFHCFPKAHFISQDATLSRLIVLTCQHPPDSITLIGSQYGSKGLVLHIQISDVDDIRSNQFLEALTDAIVQSVIIQHRICLLCYNWRQRGVGRKLLNFLWIFVLKIQIYKIPVFWHKLTWEITCCFHFKK